MHHWDSEWGHSLSVFAWRRSDASFFTVKSGETRQTGQHWWAHVQWAPEDTDCNISITFFLLYSSLICRMRTLSLTGQMIWIGVHYVFILVCYCSPPVTMWESSEGVGIKEESSQHPHSCTRFEMLCSVYLTNCLASPLLVHGGRYNAVRWWQFLGKLFFLLWRFPTFLVYGYSQGTYAHLSLKGIHVV